MHPRKHAVVSLAEGCVAEATSAPLKKTHDTGSRSPKLVRVLTPYTPAPPPHTENPSIEE